MNTTSTTSAKLQELITSKTLANLSKGTQKKTTAKAATPKAEAKEEVKVEKPKAQRTKKTTTEKAVATAKKQVENTLVEEVVSKREVKYIYPADCTDTLSRKKWRQEVRNELRKLEREMFRIEDKNSKAFKAAQKAFQDAQKKYLKKGVQVA